MKGPLRNQLKQEHVAWQRSLEHFRQENALLKYRLSEMVDNNEGSKFLQMAEYFQNEFLIVDDMLKNLFKTIHEFSAFFSGLSKEQQICEKTIAEQNKLRNVILQFEKKFFELAKDFSGQKLENKEN
jgi:hypothetical protein